MFGKLFRGLLTSQIGRIVLVALVLIGLAYAGKLYYEYRSQPQSVREAGEIEDRLSDMVDALEMWAEARGEGQAPLPDDAGWTPRTIRCGEAAEVSTAEASHPTWKALGLSFDKPVRFQFRFRSRGEEDFELLARTDRDCDGLFEVHRVEGELGWNGVSTQPIQVDNADE